MTETSPRQITDPASDGGGLSSRRRWQALAICLVGSAMVLLDVSIVNVALPSIRLGLSASDSQLQWVLSGYALAFGLALVPAGRLGDLIGRRSMFLWGLFAFTLFSAACGAAQNSTWLTVARLLQGLAGGFVTPQVSALIQQLFSGNERGKAFGIFGSVVGVSTAIGPVLGGLLLQGFGEKEGWRWVFYVNVPIGLLALPIAYRLIPPRAKDQRRKEELDLVGVVLLGLAVLLLLLPLVEEREWHGNAKWLLAVAAVALFTTFGFWERHYGRTRAALVPLALLRVPSFGAGASLGLAYFAGFTPLFFVLTLFLQTGLGYSPLDAGLSTLPFAVGSALAANVGGRLALRIGRTLVALGLLVVAVGLAGVLVAVHLHHDRHAGWWTAVPLLVAGIGGGFVISPNQTLTLSEVPQRRAGTAGGVLQTAQRVGAAIGIAAVGSVFFSRLASAAGSGSAPGAAQYAHALQVGLGVAICFVVVALVLALVDAVHDHHTAHSPIEPEESADG